MCGYGGRWLRRARVCWRVNEHPSGQAAVIPVHKILERRGDGVCVCVGWGGPGLGLLGKGRPNPAASASPFPGSSPSWLPPHFH